MNKKVAYNKGDPIRCDCCRVVAYKKGNQIFVKCKECKKWIAIFAIDKAQELPLTKD